MKKLLVNIIVYLVIKFNPKKYAMINGTLHIRDEKNRYGTTYVPLKQHMKEEHGK